SGADAVITGNWGADMIALAKAANDGGLKVPFYTYYAASDGVTAAIGAAGIDRIRLVHESHPGNPNPPKALSDYLTGYRKLHPQARRSRGEKATDPPRVKIQRPSGLGGLGRGPSGSAPRRSDVSADLLLDPQWPGLRHVALHAVQRAHAHLRHDGRAQLRARI